jgi:hypothetical protein
MRRTMFTGLIVGLLAIAMAVPAVAGGNSEHSNGRPGPGPTIIVTHGDDDPTNDLLFESFVKAGLPAEGPFQKLYPTDTPGVLTTDAGPGDADFYGGRWWADFNGNGEMDAGETFVCPLLGPGVPVS